MFLLLLYSTFEFRPPDALPTDGNDGSEHTQAMRRYRLDLLCGRADSPSAEHKRAIEIIEAAGVTPFNLRSNASPNLLEAAKGGDMLAVYGKEQAVVGSVLKKAATASG
ncbi:MAG: hypothetical protein AB7H90_17620 [Alphaproteobacteria bacterium]